MRLLRASATGLASILAVSITQGCGEDTSPTEVHRTPEFQAAAQNSKYAMMDHMKPKKATKLAKVQPQK